MIVKITSASGAINIMNIATIMMRIMIAIIMSENFKKRIAKIH